MWFARLSIRSGVKQLNVMTVALGYAEDPYDMDGSWVKEIERKFRQEEQMRERMIAAAKRRKGRARQQMLAQIPPSAFPEYRPKPRKSEAQREKELQEKQLEQERLDNIKKAEQVCNGHTPPTYL